MCEKHKTRRMINMVEKKSKEKSESKTGLGKTTVIDDENVRIVKIPKRKAQDIQSIYDNVYVPNMKKRGLESEIKPFDEWKRKTKVTVNGEETEKFVAGDTGESKEEKGTRLLTDYFGNAMSSLDRIKNLASPQYKLSDAQIKLMNDKLKAKVDEINSAFAGKVKETEKIDFSKIQ